MKLEVYVSCLDICVEVCMYGMRQLVFDEDGNATAFACRSAVAVFAVDLKAINEEFFRVLEISLGQTGDVYVSVSETIRKSKADKDMISKMSAALALFSLQVHNHQRNIYFILSYPMNFGDKKIFGDLLGNCLHDVTDDGIGSSVLLQLKRRMFDIQPIEFGYELPIIESMREFNLNMVSSERGFKPGLLFILDAISPHLDLLYGRRVGSLRIAG